MAEATIRALTDMEPMTERTPAIEIIDLPPIPAISSTSTGTLDDEALYSKFLSGNMAFEDLMKELHMKTSAPLTAAKEEKPARRRGKRQKPRLPLASDFESEKEEAGGFQFEPPEDEDYHPDADIGRRRNRRKRYRLQRKRKWDLNVELANYLGEAERHLNIGEFDLAEEICRNIIKSAPDASAPFVVLADMYFRQGRREDSRENLLQATERNPKDGPTWMRLADFAEEDGDLKTAITFARNAIRVAPEDEDFRSRLMELLTASGKDKEALRVKLTALLTSKNPDIQRVYQEILDIAEEFYGMQDVGSCIRTYELAFDKLPYICSSRDQLRVIQLLEEAERPEETLRFFLKYWGASLLTADGKTVSPYKIPSSSSVMETVKRCECIESMKLPILLKFLTLMVRFNLGRVVKDRIDSVATERNVRYHYMALYDLAKVCKSTGLADLGLKIAKLLALHPKSRRISKIICLLGDLQVECGQHQDALSTYRHVINRLDPRCTEARLSLGNLLRRLGEEKAALEILQPSHLMSQPATTTPLRPSTTANPNSSVPKRSVSSNRLPSKMDLDSSSHSSGSVSDIEDEDAGDEEEEEDEDEDLDYEEEEEDQDDEDEVSEALKLSDDSPSENSDDNDTSAPMVPSLDQNSAKHLLCNDPVAMRIAYERCRLLDAPSTWKVFLRDACHLLFYDVTQVYCCEKPDPSLMFQHFLAKDSPVENLARLDSLGSPETRVSGEDLWVLCLRVFDILLSHKEYAALDRVLAWASVLPYVVGEPHRRRHVAHLFASVAFYLGDGETVMEVLRHLEREFAHTNQFWNLLNLAITMSGELRLARFLLRRVARVTLLYI
uniref:General transcription factor 3C polypeptide 3 n=1 Tax=Schistocephalus solidus TaxID=70667 RepID=A0A0X3PDD5_SCHSO